MIWDFFDRIYVINRDADTVRMQNMDRRLKAQGIKYERVPARLPPPKAPGQTLQPGYIGCALSHMECMRRAQDARNVLVFEDDAVLRDDASAIMEEVVYELSSVYWDMLYLGWSVVGETRPVSKHLRAHDVAYHMHAYAVNVSGFADVTKACLDTLEFRQETEDVAINKIEGLTKLHVVPLLAIQAAGYGVCAGRQVNYLPIYAMSTDVGEFVAHCHEATHYAKTTK